MIAIVNLILFLYTPAIQKADPCEDIKTVEVAIGCSTVNGRRVFHDVKFSN